MRIKFTSDFDYTPSAERRVTIAYKAGMTLTVKRECGVAAIAAGAGVEAKLFNGADLSKFDHDGDGKPGGSKAKIEAPSD